MKEGNRQLAVAAIASLLAVSGTRADEGFELPEPQKQSGWNKEISIGYKSNYAVSDAKVELAGPSIQADLYMRHENGVFVDLWANKAIEKSKDGFKTNEIDLTIGKDTEIGNGLNLTTQVGYFYFPDGGPDFLSPKVVLSKSFENRAGNTSVDIEAKGLVPIPSDGIRSQITLSAGAAHEVQ